MRPGITTDIVEENRTLKHENTELRRTNEILKAASVFFAKELDMRTSIEVKLAYYADAEVLPILTE